MNIKDSVALVTGANRGLGRASALELAARGAKIDAVARDPSTVKDSGLIPVQLDATNEESIQSARCAATFALTDLRTSFGSMPAATCLRAS